MYLELLKGYQSDKIFDGEENYFYNDIIDLPDGFNAEFKSDEFFDIEDMLPIVEEENFKKVVSVTEVAKASQYFPNSYSGSDGLPLQLVIKGDLLILVSAGEF